MNAEGHLVEAAGVNWRMWARCLQCLSPHGTRRSDREMVRQPGRRVACGLWGFQGYRDHTVFAWSWQNNVLEAKMTTAPLGLRSVNSEQPLPPPHKCTLLGKNQTVVQARFGERESMVNRPRVQSTVGKLWGQLRSRASWREIRATFTVNLIVITLV